MSECTSCGATVRFVQSEKPPHKWMILNPLPYADGNVVIDRERAVVFKDAEAAHERYPGSQLYVDHHVTCPQGEAWTRLKRQQAKQIQLGPGGEP